MRRGAGAVERDGFEICSRHVFTSTRFVCKSVVRHALTGVLPTPLS